MQTKHSGVEKLIDAPNRSSVRIPYLFAIHILAMLFSAPCLAMAPNQRPISVTYVNVTGNSR